MHSNLGHPAPGPNLCKDVEIANVAPTVDFAFYPDQNYVGNAPR